MLDAAAGPRGTPAGHAHRSAAPTRADRLIGLMGDFGMGTRRLPQPAPSFLTQPGGPARRARHGPGRASPAPGLPRGRPRAIRGGVPASRCKVAGPATRSRSAARSTRWHAGVRQSQRERTARSRRGAACRRAVRRRFPTGPAARQAPGCAPRADHRVDAGLASGAGGLDVQPVGILAADHPDEGAFAGEPLGPVPGGGIGQVEGAPVGVAAASTARRERAGQSDKRFRMPRSPGRVPPRCTARVPRNSARLEHLTRFDRRREAEQGDRLPPRSPDGRPLAGRRTKPQAGRVGLHHQLPPDRYLNSIPSPEIEASGRG